jgi:hypothetical protein
VTANSAALKKSAQTEASWLSTTWPLNLNELIDAGLLPVDTASGDRRHDTFRCAVLFGAGSFCFSARLRGIGEVIVDSDEMSRKTALGSQTVWVQSMGNWVYSAMVGNR